MLNSAGLGLISECIGLCTPKHSAFGCIIQCTLKPIPSLNKRGGLVVLVQVQRPLKIYEKNPKNMTTAVGEHRFGKGDR